MVGLEDDAWVLEVAGTSRVGGGIAIDRRADAYHSFMPWQDTIIPRMTLSREND
jgi:hypothetical protein